MICIAIFVEDEEINKLLNKKEPEMIKFIMKEENKSQLTFNDVKIDQFFVNESGRLCQKANHTNYNIIANENGKLCAATRSMAFPDEPILKIIPEIERIEF